MRHLLIAALLLVALAVAACGGGDPSLPAAGVLLNPSPRPTAAYSPSPAPPPVAPLTLADVFPPRELISLGLDPARLRTVIATGDVIPARYTDVTIRERGDDFLYTVAATSNITRAANITLIDLESPLIEECPYHDSGFTFCGRPGFTAALRSAGVDLATLENRHISNYGPSGIEETEQHLEAAGIRWADSARPSIIDVRGMKFGFLAFNGVIGAIDRDAMVAGIHALRPQVDVLAVAIHWGAEYVSLPQAAPGVAPDNPVEIAHLAVDSGVDVVIGNHPHRVQAVEFYGGKFIAYAHGNFIFDQMWSYETRAGVIGKYTFYDDALVGVEYIPTLIEDWSQPVPLEGAERQAVLDGMKSASEQLASLLAEGG